MFTSESNDNNISNLEIRNNILEESMECFNHQFSFEEENSERNNYIQLSLIIFEKKQSHTIHDNFYNIDIKVKFDKGVPVCTLCNSYDCAHIWVYNL